MTSFSIMPGFLDGGDRTMVLSQQNTPSVALSDSQDSVASPETPAILTPPMDHNLDNLNSRAIPTLLVSNLPTVIFSHAADLDPLLCPFGDIVQLKLLKQAIGSDSLSVTVEYRTVTQAQEARDSLNGQLYADRCLQAEFLLPQSPSPVASEFSTWSLPSGDNKPGLNPFAVPFQVQSGVHSAFLGDIGAPKHHTQDCYGNSDGLVAARRWSGYSTPNSVLPPAQSLGYPCSGLLAPSLATFRPHSAPSE